MATFLVGIQYHEPESFALWKRGVIEDYESSTGLFIEAASATAAIEWAEKVAEALLRKSNSDESLQWKDYEYGIWIEEDPEKSTRKHCLSFFPRIEVGEWPNLEEMGTPAYVKWAEANSIR
jgi:hypothetical protein